MIRIVMKALREAGFGRPRRPSRRIAPTISGLEDRQMLSGQGANLTMAALPAITVARQTTENGAAQLSGQTSFVTGLYNSILLRNPQSNEVDYWLGQLRGGLSPTIVRSEFFNSDEHRQLLAGLNISLGGSNQQFVDMLYTNLLERHAEPGGEAFWIKLLRIGERRQSLIQSFLTSPEFQQSGQTVTPIPSPSPTPTPSPTPMPAPTPTPTPVPTPPPSSTMFVETNLVASVQGLAHNTDPSLQNPWGVSFAAGGPFWVSNQITGNSTLYNAVGVPNPLVVTIPPGPNGGNPTGQIANTTANDFLIGGASPLFLFASLNGTISGWTGGASTATQAPIPTQPSGSSFTGLELANNGTGNFLYAANDGLGRIDVFDTHYQTASAFAGKFSDPALSTAGFTPYNIRDLGGKMYVAYENSGTGGGAVDVFDLNGNLLQHLTENGAGGPLSHPWGMALAPAGFGQLGGDLLVGNEGDGHTNAFDPATGQFIGQMALVSATNGNATSIGFGLWTLTFGGSGDDGNPNTLYFTAGINNEKGGLFGSIQAVSKP